MKVPTHWGADGPGTEGSARLWSGWRQQFQAALLRWYRPRARLLRIRSTTDPWALLVAEVMAQQTQISRVDAAWARFLERYPTPRDLANASTADVLRAWSGLGYNRRALNLQRAAALIEGAHDGLVPDRIEALEALPGIGPYTARAVAATAFGQPVAPVDTNVRRVVSRVAGAPLSPRELQAAADDLVVHDDPASWAHASMELGATVCRARRARCEECPVSAWCASAGRVGAVGSRRGAGELPFELTTRWLRGRIVEQLCALEEAAWMRLPDAVGSHGAPEIDAAVVVLERDGLLERRPDGAVRLPSRRT